MNKVIKNIALTSEDKLVIDFTDNTQLVLFDNGQSCCEYRYMVCDEDLSYYIGATYNGWYLGDCNVDEEDWAVKECQFLNINTSLGDIQIANYNEHNGYYGGFLIVEKMI